MLFQRTFIFILGIFVFLISSILLIFSLREDGWFVVLGGIIVGTGFGYIGMLWMLAAFVDEETFYRRVTWLFEAPAGNPLGLIVYLILMLFLRLIIGIFAVIMTYCLKGVLYMKDKLVHVLY